MQLAGASSVPGTLRGAASCNRPGTGTSCSWQARGARGRLACGAWFGLLGPCVRQIPTGCYHLVLHIQLGAEIRTCASIDYAMLLVHVLVPKHSSYWHRMLILHSYTCDGINCDIRWMHTLNERLVRILSASCTYETDSLHCLYYL